MSGYTTSRLPWRNRLVLPCHYTARHFIRKLNSTQDLLNTTAWNYYRMKQDHTFNVEGNDAIPLILPSPQYCMPRSAFSCSWLSMAAASSSKMYPLRVPTQTVPPCTTSAVISLYSFLRMFLKRTDKRGRVSCDLWEH